MSSYSPLDDGETRHVRKFPREMIVKHIFGVGILINALFSLYLITISIPDHTKDTSSSHKYKSLSRDTFDEYLNLANLDFDNSSALFNEVSNAVKQKNADLNPIGVTYFPAYIPEGTFLYHSNGDGLVPTSFEWVAMDYEFSYNFAHFSRPNRGFGGGGGPWKHRKPPPGGFPGGKKPHMPPHFPGMSNQTRIPHLLTFEVTKPLDKLIYLGGASAAKSRTGEMDTQYLLSQIGDYDEFDERVGADQICKWGNSDGRTLDGIIRLEIGFEIIICNFNEKLQVVQNLTLSNATDILEFPAEVAVDTKETSLSKRSDEDLNKERSAVIDIFENMSGFEQYQSGERVYDGDDRILLDFSKIVTMINRTYLTTDTYVRRINDISPEVNSSFLQDMHTMLSQPSFDPYYSTNWQVVTENIIQKFTPIFMTLNLTMSEYLIKNEGSPTEPEYLSNLEVLAQNITTYTYNFVRRYTDLHYTVNSEEEIKDKLQMMVWDYIHPHQPLQTDADFMIWASIGNVQTKIVHEIYDIFLLGKGILLLRYVANDKSKLLDPKLGDKIVKAYQSLNKLLDNLNWSILYQCTRVCAHNEICFVPTWGPSPLSWGGTGGLDTHHTTSDGIKRINKDFICLSPQLLMSLKNNR